MVLLSRYWEILKLDPADDGIGYRSQVLVLAWEFFQEHFPACDPPERDPNQAPFPHHRTQTSLYTWFRAESALNLQQAAIAGLCLRCYVSHAILGACHKLGRLFATSQVTYRDLLSLVLEDDGKAQIVLDQDGKTQLMLDAEGNAQPTHFPLFAVEILRTFDPNRSPETQASLTSWVYRHVKQNTKLKQFFAEQGVCLFSDWALLNKVSDRQLDELSAHDRTLITAFHQVYRRDRRRGRSQQTGKCPDPTPAQLQEMCHHLQQSGIRLSKSALLHELHGLAASLRHLDQWMSRGAPLAEPIDSVDPHTGQVREFPSPTADHDVSMLEQQDIQDFCHHQLQRCLGQAIAQGLADHVATVRSRPRYAKFADRITQGLWMIYGQGKSQGEIAPSLGMTNQVQVSRVLDLRKLVNIVRSHTVDHLFQVLLDKATGLDLAQLATVPDYAKNLQTAVEEFADTEIFQAADAEIMTAKHRLFRSLYAQQLRQFIHDHEEVRRP